MKPAGLEAAFLAADKLLKATKSRGLYVGGVALMAAGEPRMTKDVDLILFLAKDLTGPLIDAADKSGFTLSRAQVSEDISFRHTFRFMYRDVAVDFIIASSPLERSAWSRRRRLKIFGRVVAIPSAEDLILLKLVPGRPQDMVDAQRIVERTGPKLDRRYLRQWAEQLDGEAQDSRFTVRLEKIGVKS